MATPEQTIESPRALVTPGKCLDQPMAALLPNGDPRSCTMRISNGHICQSGQSNSEAASTWWNPSDRAPLQLGEDKASRFLGSGWSYPEKEGRWTIGTSASLRFQAQPGTGQVLILRLQPFLVSGRLGRQRLGVRLNETDLTWLEMEKTDWQEHTICLPAGAVKNLNEVTFCLPDATAPFAVALNDDQRVLAMFVQSVRLESLPCPLSPLVPKNDSPAPTNVPAVDGPAAAFPCAPGSINPPCCIIAGHHRSGTSLVASLLQSAGLDIGQNLNGACDSNVHGHFEDTNFLQYHMQVLAAQGLDVSGYVCQPRVEVPQPCRAAARALVRARAQEERPWGWKEPRTVLFLDFWKELIPNACFLLLFRRPWEVLDSLFRRGDPAIMANPNRAAQVWISYNRAILDFYDRNPASCLLVESRAVARQPNRLIDTLRDRFGLRLGPPANLYDESLMQEGTARNQAQLRHLYPEAISVYQELRGRAAAAETPPLDNALTAADWALQDWADLSHLRKQTKATEVARATELQGMHTELTRVLTELEGLRADLTQVRGQLEGARGQVQEVEAARATALQEKQLAEACRAQTLVDLEAERATRLRAELESYELQARLGDTERALQCTCQQLEAARANQIWMEGSKFWKLRRLWFRLRHPLLQEAPDRRRPRYASHSAIGGNATPGRLISRPFPI